jgi:hypothetical protein
MKVGNYSFTEFLDTRRTQGGPFAIVYDVEVTEDTLKLDTSRSSNQCKGPMNFLLPQESPSLSLSVELLGGDRRYMINAGASRLLDNTTFREGSSCNRSGQRPWARGA